MVSATVNSVTTTFAYRGDGLRESRTVGMSTTTFTWDVNAGLPVVLSDGNFYLYGLGLEAMEQSGDWYYFLADGLGSTMAIVDDTGAVQNSYTYDVYGEPTVTGSLQNEFDFAGQQTDADTGLQYLRARYMDPETGVFFSRDPLAAVPSWLGSHFGYAGGNPATATDPTGLCDDGSPMCAGTDSVMPSDGWRIVSPNPGPVYFNGHNYNLAFNLAPGEYLRQYFENGIGGASFQVCHLQLSGEYCRSVDLEAELNASRWHHILDLLDDVTSILTFAGTHKLGM